LKISISSPSLVKNGRGGIFLKIDGLKDKEEA
jgi:hypothetical protein